MADPTTLLIYAPVPLYRVGDRFYQEDQACNGLRLWAEHFDKVIVMSPLASGPPPNSWVPIDAVGPSLARIEVVDLPMAYRPDQFARAYGQTSALIRDLIARSDYLSFSIGGLFGDWGSVACWQAHRMGRPFAVWTDRVESEVVRRGARSGTTKERIRARLAHRPMAWLEKFLIRRASLGLFHGQDTFDAYAPHCANPHLVHDIHIRKPDHISADLLATKIASCAEGPLRISYVGRADQMKGPMDWIDVLTSLDTDGVDFTATWLGDGSYLEQMRAAVAQRGLEARVSMPGFTSDRQDVIAAFRNAHVFMFCHKTPESPRCLIEALTSGTPIVGYDNAFAADLISQNGGGRMVPLNDTAALSAAMVRLGRDRAALADLIARAARDGEPFDDETVFRHRSEVIKANLPGPDRSAAAA